MIYPTPSKKIKFLTPDLALQLLRVHCIESGSMWRYVEVVGIARGPDRVGIALCLDPVVCLAALIVKKV